MDRRIGVLNLLQAGVYVAVAVLLGRAWWPVGVAFGGAAAAQVAGGIALLAGRGPGIARGAAVGSLAVAGLAVGLHLQIGVYIARTYTAGGSTQGWQLLGVVALAVPWVAFFPVWQLLASRAGRLGGGAAALALLGVVVPPLVARAATAPTASYASVDGGAVAAWAWDRITGADAGPPPDAPGDVLVLVSTVRRGRVGETRALSGSGLADALSGLDLAAAPAPDLGVHVEVVTEVLSLSAPWLAPDGYLFVRPAGAALLGGDRAVTSVEAWRSPVRHPKVGAIRLPALRAGSFPGVAVEARVQGWLASHGGVVRLEDTWTSPPELTPDALLAAAEAGGRHLVANMRGDRFAYVVRGPSGEPGRGYNFPRHAGATWFLARLANRTGDPVFRDAARRGLAFLEAHTEHLPDGRAYVVDPGRRDGKAWVGTTALGLLGALELGEDPSLAQAWASHVASSVDARGAVRGDLDRETATWPEQPLITYGQGQGLLALAAAERAGLTGIRDALVRAADHVDGDYWPMPAARFHLLDEHWMCLAAIAAHDALGRPAGARVCDAYTQANADRVPVAGSRLQPPAGFAGGIAEAYVARAELARRAGEGGPHLDRAHAFGALLLSNLYQATDAPMLGNPQALVGGFRDTPWALDVRVDAVQHIGCALLGVEQLLRGEPLPGAMP